jgi:hypothetical protein
MCAYSVIRNKASKKVGFAL